MPSGDSWDAEVRPYRIWRGYELDRERGFVEIARMRTLDQAVRFAKVCDYTHSEGYYIIIRRDYHGILWDSRYDLDEIPDQVDADA